MRSEHTLYVVATPIGHREDLSPRAVQTLREVTRIYAEDTRHSLPLMRHHGVETRLHALHEHNETSEAERVAEHVRTVGSAALITDAGTPLISDPGFRVVRACERAGVRVSPVPGPCALSAALSVGGLPTDRFEFVGFPPSRSIARRAWLEALAGTPHTLVLYESPHRLLDTLADLAAVFGERREATLARELTKRHETLLRGALGELLERVRTDPDQRRGEIVLMVAGSAWHRRAVKSGREIETGGGDDDGGGGVRCEDGAVDGDEDGEQNGGALALDRVLRVLLEHLPPKELARCAAELCGVTRRTAYERALALRGRGPRR